MPIFNLVQFSGAIRNDADLRKQACEFFTKAPGPSRNKYASVILAGDELYFYGVFSARSHFHARKLALNSHLQVQSERPEVDCAVAVIVLGACRKKRCCKGRMYVSFSVRCPGWAHYDDLKFADSEFRPEMVDKVIADATTLQRFLTEPDENPRETTQLDNG